VGTLRVAGWLRESRVTAVVEGAPGVGVDEIRPVGVDFTAAGEGVAGVGALEGVREVGADEHVEGVEDS
jgi:hypothetical protein